ncbi:putative DNA-binding protein with PD1-like motif [Bradyrhizobium diazoefficiens]
MRSIKQPGAPGAERIQWVEARGRAFTFMLEAGVPLLEAARRGFAAEGFAGGVLNFGRGTLGPFAYVMPALSKTGENAAFYSETFRPEGVTRTKLGRMTLGTRDGAPFFHCHGLWTEADGKASGGHMLPDETIVTEPFEVESFGLDGAMFTAEPDPETNFKLFGPVAAASTGARTTSRAFALRLRPNQDFAFCLEGFLPRARHCAREDSWRRRLDHRRPLHPWRRDRAVCDGACGDCGGDRTGPFGCTRSGARCRADRLHRRHRGGASDPWRQSRADDHGIGARGVELISASDRQ